MSWLADVLLSPANSRPALSPLPSSGPALNSKLSAKKSSTKKSNGIKFTTQSPKPNVLPPKERTPEEWAPVLFGSPKAKGSGRRASIEA